MPEVLQQAPRVPQIAGGREVPTRPLRLVQERGDRSSPRRDFEEGLAGRLYDVCGDCVKKENERLAEEAEAYERDHGYEGVWDDDDYDDYDEGDHL